MRADLLALGAALGIGMTCLTACQTARNVAGRAVAWIPGFHAETPAKEKGAVQKALKSNGLEMSLNLAPHPLSLSETRRIQVTLRLTNVSRRFVQLEFPTTQRIELLLRDKAGNTLAQWSEDQLFEPTPGVVGINPGEHLEYRAALATRDLYPGGSYTVTAFFPTRPDLKLEIPISPVR